MHFIKRFLLYTKFAARRVKINDSFLARYIAPGTEAALVGLPDNKNASTGYRTKGDNQIFVAVLVSGMYLSYKVPETQYPRFGYRWR